MRIWYVTQRGLVNDSTSTSTSIHPDTDLPEVSIKERFALWANQCLDVVRNPCGQGSKRSSGCVVFGQENQKLTMHICFSPDMA